jgi:AcrR family transcriptional regulator
MGAMTDPILRDRIIDTALLLAERRSWEAVRLHDVAAELGVALADIQPQFREKEDIVFAWFERADFAMLSAARAPGYAALGPRERIVHLLMAWLGALVPYRRVARQMVLNKFEPGHIHYQLAELLRISRTVQWLREAAHRDAVLPWRALEETALTGVYLATFGYWVHDDSPDAARTRAFADCLLARGERFARLVPGFQVAA